MLGSRVSTQCQAGLRSLPCDAALYWCHKVDIDLHRQETQKATEGLRQENRGSGVLVSFPVKKIYLE